MYFRMEKISRTAARLDGSKLSVDSKLCVSPPQVLLLRSYHLDVPLNLPVRQLAASSLQSLGLVDQHIPIRDRFIPEPNLMLSGPSKVVHEIIT